MTSIPSPRQERQPPLIDAEHGYLTLAAAAVPLGFALVLADWAGVLQVVPGTYSLLAAATAVGGCGWLVRSGDTRRRRAIADLQTRMDNIETLLARLAVLHSRSGDPAPVYVGRASGDTLDLSGRDAARAHGFAEGYVEGVRQRLSRKDRGPERE